jgi:hypothetical protein
MDPWPPVFFFAMITHDPHQVMVGGLARCGRVMFAGGAVMAAVDSRSALARASAGRTWSPVRAARGRGGADRPGDA